MSSEKFLSELAKSIKEFILKSGEKIKPINVEIKREKYSLLFEKDSLKIYSDGKNIPVRDTKVTYQCACGAIHTILLKKFLKKERMKCQSCREDEEKRYNHSQFFKSGVQKHILEQEKNIDYDFYTESVDFQRKYYLRHLNSNEFYDLLPHIFSIKGIKTQGKKIEYLEHESIQNQYKYMPYVIIEGRKVPFLNVELKCEECGKVFSISDRRSKREKIVKDKIMCKDCAFYNKRYPIKHIKTKFGDLIQYQSETELSFIKECENLNVRILNGDNITYQFNNSQHIYRIDFYLPDYNYLIEIKANHVWHRKQIESGKWAAKEISAIAYAKNNNLNFKVLFFENFTEFFSSLKR